MLTAATLRHQEAARVWELRDQIIDSLADSGDVINLSKYPAEIIKGQRNELREQINLLARFAEYVEDDTQAEYVSTAAFTFDMQNKLFMFLSSPIQAQV